MAEASTRLFQQANPSEQNLNLATLYGLFEPLGAPLESTETFGSLGYGDNDILEFKRLPPHLVQRQKVNERLRESSKGPKNGSDLPSNVFLWTVEEVCQWLTSNGFGEFSADFRQGGYNGEKLFSLTNETLRDGK